MSVVWDFAWFKPTVADLLAHSVTAVGMYVSNDPTKNANLSLVKTYAAAGIKTFLFFENTATRAAAGYAAGLADAKFAYATAAAYGKPAWAPIVPTVDFDVPDYAPNSNDPKMKLGPVGEYFRAWHDYNQSIGVIADAAYGDFYVIKRLTAAGLATLSVQTLAWSAGQIDLADIVLYQNGQMADNGNVDIEVIENSALLTHLAWVPGEANPTTPPNPYPTLASGATGPAVTTLQTRLNVWGAKLTVDGSFGAATLAAVKAFQTAHGLTSDGVVGPATWTALLKTPAVTAVYGIPLGLGVSPTADVTITWRPPAAVAGLPATPAAYRIWLHEGVAPNDVAVPGYPLNLPGTQTSMKLTLKRGTAYIFHAVAQTSATGTASAPAAGGPFTV